MIRDACYVHTNLIARDWQQLSAFYESVFGCRRVPPERKFAGPDLEAGTGIAGAALEGVHLRLPGLGESGPTLEIFSYSDPADRVSPAVNRPGFAHIAFRVPSVAGARREVLAGGGGSVGDIVTLRLKNGRRVRWCYVTDPEENIIELQSWE
jgi:catechol 2,3-dioxygenase-like lactoylglutathione lyase family enzyme